RVVCHRCWRFFLRVVGNVDLSALGEGGGGFRGCPGYVVRSFRRSVVPGGSRGLRIGRFRLEAAAIGAAPAGTPAAPAAPGAFLVLLLVLGLRRFLLGAQQRLPVGNRDLIVVGMDFAEGKEAVPVPAIFDESCLKGRLDPRDAGEIDVSFELLLVL